MKSILITLAILASGSAFAANFKCQSQLSQEITVETLVQSWPLLYVGMNFRECHSTADGRFCSEGPLDQIASEKDACFRKIYNIRTDCTFEEPNGGLLITCKNGSVLSFELDSSGLGKITCTENGVLKKSWYAGTCQVR
jgi:hypothetical protein